MSGVIILVNYIKRSALNTRLFRELCKEFNDSSENPVSKGNVHKEYLNYAQKFKRLFTKRKIHTCYSNVSKGYVRGKRMGTPALDLQHILEEKFHMIILFRIVTLYVDLIYALLYNNPFKVKRIDYC